MLKRTLFLTLLGVALTAAPSSAEDVRLSGFVAGELRSYIDKPQFDGQFSGAEASLILSPEFRWRSDDRAHQVSVIPYLRLANRDAERTHGDLREAYWRYLGDEFELLVGINKVFWGVTESRHLVDIINQSDAVEDVDEEDKLGQPMVTLGRQFDWGRVDLYALTGFRDRTFPGTTGRIRAALPIDEDNAVYDSSRGRGHIDVAARYSHFIGDWDIGLSVFHGLSREARLVKSADGTKRTPYYDLITQAGIDLQYTQDAWLWKWEAIVRDGQGEDPFFAAVGGVEYTFYQVAESDADVGVLAELHRDLRSPSSAPATTLEEDLFVGARLTLNDIQDTSALIGATIDKDDQSMFWSIEAERRLGDLINDHWKAELEARFLVNTDGAGDSAAFQRDSFVTLRLSRYF